MKAILKKLIWLIMAVPAVYLAIIWNKLPDRVAMHFDLEGHPDRYGNKSELITVVVIFIVMNALVYLVLTNIYRIDPKKYAIENKDRIQSIALAISTFLAAILFVILHSTLKGNIKFSMSLIFAAVGLLLAIIGNYLPNLKPNYFAGLRLPWTLENEENWKRTHRLAGKLFFAGGLILGVACLFIPPIASIIIFCAGTMIMVIIPAVYSYKLYRRQKITNNR